LTFDDALQYIDKRIKEIDDDERYHYKPASIKINAPLALMQMEMVTEMDVLKTIKAKLETR